MNDIIVIDTNVLVSGLLNPQGNPATIIRMIIARTIRTILDSRIFHEYDVVLKRPRFGFSPDDVNALLSFFKQIGLWIVPLQF
jgi:putative PIN family toxin of toxin-antitoxin system